MRNNNNKWMQNPIIKPILVLIGILAALKLYKVYKAGKSTGEKIAGDIKNSAQSAGISAALTGSGIPTTSVRASAVIEVAEDVYSALHKDSMWGWGEDEDKAVDSFNTLLNVAEAKAAARVYKTNYKKSLHDDVVKYIHGSSFAKIKSYLLNATKGV